MTRQQLFTNIENLGFEVIELNPPYDKYSADADDREYSLTFTNQHGNLLSCEGATFDEIHNTAKSYASQGIA